MTWGTSRGCGAALRATRSIRWRGPGLQSRPIRVTIGSGDDERKFRRTRSVPRCALLRARRLPADPLALSPLSLPEERRTRARFAGGAALRATALSHSACRHVTRPRRAVRGRRFCDPLRLFERLTGAVLSWGTPKASPSRSQTGNSRPRVAGCARWPAPGRRFTGFPSPSHPRRKAGRMPRMRLRREGEGSWNSCYAIASAARSAARTSGGCSTFARTSDSRGQGVDAQDSKSAPTIGHFWL